MDPWDALTFAEQTLMRRAMFGNGLAWTIQQYGIDLRWAGAEGAPTLRNYTEDEERALVPQLAAAALGLVGRGLMTIRVRQGHFPAASDPVLTGVELREVLADPANWRWESKASRNFDLAATESATEQWRAAASPKVASDALPAWDELSIGQREVLVCAMEGSGMLTGPFGIWEDLPTELGSADRAEWVDHQLAPLLPFVRDGWIEVRHLPGASSDAFTVIPLDELHAAFADPVLRYDGDDGDDWGVGLTCVFTHAGLAVMRG
ncbi:hypothetical protein [Kitasatospora sp. MAP5-34]|uniref:hypothetical protein n=1 Tax=Kitasatospora sp. MAP5-34 TaxID=3035102 RepID=UPI0024744AF3|nr:hypothetical protein [Kitasatospora sp. MAP5-34]MDH6576462.1 hypothetical protein [Kitasatospora sp. MAP5-34]